MAQTRPDEPPARAEQRALADLASRADRRLAMAVSLPSCAVHGLCCVCAAPFTDCQNEIGQARSMRCLFVGLQALHGPGIWVLGGLVFTLPAKASVGSLPHKCTLPLRTRSASRAGTSTTAGIGGMALCLMG